MKSALVIGASGLVGRQLVFELIKHPAYSRIKALSRKDLVIEAPKLEQHLIDFSQLESYSNLFDVDELYIAIGTTRSKTPDLETYRKIDQEIPMRSARLAYEKGCKQVFFVSSMGADRNSSIFYSKLKGETEQMLSEIGFPACHLIRPSLLMGQRNEFRPLEAFSQLLMKGLNLVMIGPLRAYKGIQGFEVARAMVKIAQQNLSGNRVWLNNELLDQLEKK
ncbi:MAG: NAD-dependent epimerase/dehydratase family protein [Bacteroidia bacterium]|nr:NAD-dependent epimerase/dehydratase family protein [Bacteroidia bacterium]